ncbi:MAG: 2-C-methyl-D-erythritol 4-phosphate cytidylyltransferase [Pseudomonadota bacterium]
MSKYFALIPAAGSGSRMGGELPKQYLPLAGKPMLYHALKTLVRHAAIARVYVVLAPDDTIFAQHDWRELFGFGGKLQPLYCGGTQRAASVLNGLRAARGEIGDDDWVMVHDAARPGLTQELLDRLIAEVGDDAAGGLLALPVADTLKRGDAGARVVRTEARDELWGAQTPQMFRYALLVRALAATDPAVATDEARAVEGLGLHPKLVRGDSRNLKVTYPQDMQLAESILNGGQGMRIGQGYDVHALAAGRKLIIGGVEVAHDQGLLGHSDADVLLHAVTDALLGAAALGDIGRHFPDTDPRYKGADSRVLLREAARLVAQAGFRVVNVDATIIAQQPKMAPHIPAMVANIAADLGVAAGDVNVKAKTNEKLGHLGREEGIAAHAVAALLRS